MERRRPAAVSAAARTNAASAVIGIEENERNISNKIGRGTFTAVFFVQYLKAIGCQMLHLDES